MNTTAGMPSAPAAAVFSGRSSMNRTSSGSQVQPLERPLEILGVRLDHAFEARNEIAVEPPEEVVNLDAPLPVLAFHVAERVARHPCRLQLGEHLHAALDDAAYHLFGTLAPSVDHLGVTPGTWPAAQRRPRRCSGRGPVRSARRAYRRWRGSPPFPPRRRRIACGRGNGGPSRGTHRPGPGGLRSAFVELR